MLITYALSGPPTLDDIDFTLNLARANGDPTQGCVTPIRIGVNNTHAAGGIALAAVLQHVVDRVRSLVLLDCNKSLVTRDLDPVCCGVKELLATFSCQELNHSETRPGLWQGD